MGGMVFFSGDLNIFLILSGFISKSGVRKMQPYHCHLDSFHQFPLTQVQNAHAGWWPAVIFAVCSSAAFLAWRHKRCEATQQSAFAATSSSTLVPCVSAFRL